MCGAAGPRAPPPPARHTRPCPADSEPPARPLAPPSHLLVVVGRPPGRCAHQPFPVALKQGQGGGVGVGEHGVAAVAGRVVREHRKGRLVQGFGRLRDLQLSVPQQGGPRGPAVGFDEEQRGYHDADIGVRRLLQPCQQAGRLFVAALGFGAATGRLMGGRGTGGGGGGALRAWRGGQLAPLQLAPPDRWHSPFWRPPPPGAAVAAPCRAGHA